MPLIDRAWKASVNVWKRHLNLQSVFNHGECMMHVDKNSDSHVLDQNVDRILREIAYVPLNGKIKSKRSSCMEPFFFSLKKKKNEYKTCLLVVTTKWGFQSWSWILDMLPIGLMDLKFWMCFPKVRWIWIWTCFLEARWFKVWTCFLEVQWIWILDILPRGTMDLNLDVLPRGPMDLKFGRTSQRSNGIGRYYSYQCVWAFYPDTYTINTFN